MDMFKTLPDSVEIGGIEYKLNTDFRIGIKAESVLTDKTRPEESKVEEMIRLYFPVCPPWQYGKEIVSAIIWFYTGEDVESNKKRRSMDGEEKRHFSFEHDSALVFSAFYQQYGVDLSEIEYMHWWKFKAMFASLSEETQLVKVIQYRATKITSKMPKETADFYRKMKRLYALPEDKYEDRKASFVAEALLRGESLEGITERYYEKYGAD